MSMRRVAVAGTLIALTAAVAPAHAAKPHAKPPVCKLVKDGTGEAGAFNNPNGATYDSALDIASADVGTNGKMFGAIIRMKKLAKSDSMSPGGQHIEMTFTVGADSFAFFTDILGDGTINYPDSVTYSAWDEAASELRFAVPLAKLNKPIKNGSQIRSITITTNAIVGAKNPQYRNGVTLTKVDDASGGPTVVYVAGTPSCVKYS